MIRSVESVIVMGADLRVRLMCESLHVTNEFVMRGGEQVGRDRERLVCALNAMIFFLEDQ